ncbi:hypothetical protein MXB_5358 [Myxobolus squamalis]|nr:hypothetical protein MXB_5358 [Myxobolus squamalis]
MFCKIIHQANINNSCKIIFNIEEKNTESEIEKFVLPASKEDHGAGSSMENMSTLSCDSLMIV